MYYTVSGIITPIGVMIPEKAKIVLYSLWYHYTYTCNDTRDCIMQFCPPDDKHVCSKHVEA